MEINSFILKNKHIYPSDGKYLGIKIVFFSDLHIGKLLKKEKLKKILSKLVSLNGDVYIFGGDLIGQIPQKYYTKADIADCFSIFNHSLNLRVYGNHEFKEERGIDFKIKEELFSGMENFRLLKNEMITFQKGELSIQLIGLMENKYHQAILPPFDVEKTSIAVVHQGDTFDYLNDVTLTLSGHTHGGQIRFFQFKPLYLPSQGKKYIAGLYEKEKQSLIVSKGLGCNYLNFRICAKRDVVIIDYRGE